MPVPHQEVIRLAMAKLITRLPLSRKAQLQRINTLCNSLPGVNFDAVFGGPRGQYDLLWAIQLLDGLSPELTRDLFKQYARRRKDCSFEHCRSANIWLRERTRWVRKLIQSIPVDPKEMRDEDGRKKVAHQFANQTAAIYRNIEQGIKEGAEPDLLQTWELMRQPADQWGFIGKMPKFKSDEVRDNWILSVLVRLLSAKWWEKRVNRCWDRLQEQINILLGKVRKGVSAFVSNATIKVVRERKRAMMRWLAESEVVNEQYDLVVSMKDCWEASNANPVNRRNEMMVRARGFSDYAEELGHVGVFFTWTAPSRFHAWAQKHNGKAVENKRYQGATPRETCAYLAKLWSRARAALKRWNAPVYGFRVCEAHHDGTPHWHLLLFMRPEDRNRVIGILRRYALTDDHDELVRNIKGSPPFTDFTPRFDWEEIDPTKGDAAGYIAKYIAKNIDGAYLDDDEEAGTAANEAAQHAVAWASWWGIRTFQQIGGAPVGVWRELRRISNAKKNADLVGPPKPVLQDPRFEAARFAADNGIFRCYLHAMGGALATRAEHPIKLAHLIEEQANSYGEDIKRLMGITSARLGIKTRLQGWEIVPAGTHEARKAAEAAARGVGVKTGDSPAPWSSDNNCTRPDPDAFADQIMREQWGLSPFSIERLRAGANVSTDGFTLWLENGQVQSSHLTPSGDDDPLIELEWLRAMVGVPEPDEQPDTVNPDDEHWPTLVMDCYELFNTCGFEACHQWISALPNPYQCELWRVLDKLDWADRHEVESQLFD
ncbi:replication endonuclease [Aeromonas enteropelogenes]|uniref:replication endonuclease n=1 Tax=Aeromonas enteropelogenes TaxID=29489 RepID=UPI003B9F84BF